VIAVRRGVRSCAGARARAALAATGLAASAFASACGGSPRPSAPSTAATLPQLPPAPPDAYGQGGAGDDVGVAAAPFRADEDPELAPPDRPSHEQALARARAGDYVASKRLLGRLVVAYPSHQVLVDQYNAVVAEMERAQAAAKRALEGGALRELPPPPAKYTLARPARVGDPALPRLSKESSKKNQIVDDEAWFTANGVHLPEYFVPPARDVLFAPGAVSSSTVVNLLAGFSYTEYQPSGRFAPESLPFTLPASYGTMPLTRAIDSAPYTVAIYGARVVAVFEGKGALRALFDLVNFVHPPASKHGDAVIGQATLTTAAGTQRGAITVPTDTISHEIMFALAKGGTLFVEHTNLMYAKDNRGQNAFVSAIDLATGDLAWRSQPLVANGRNFALVRGAVVCGYGFTAEPDFLYVLNAATGAVSQKLPVHSGPDYFAEKDGKMFVRTYDTDEVFAIQ